MQLKRNKEMEFERLKKSHKKQIIIGALAICVIGGALTFNLTRAKYRLTQDLELAKGTINYKVPDLRVVALYTANDSGTYVEANNVPSSGYTLNKTKSVCKVYDGTTSVENAPVDSNITIEYKGGEIYISKLNKKNTRCYLYFDKQASITMDSLIESLPVKVGSPDFSKTATTNEGIYATYDGMYEGISYYWRGAVTNNYVKFANFCWRIVRINGDKTMRLIYDGTTCHANGTKTTESIAVQNVAYNTSVNQSNYVGWTYEGQLQRPSNNNAATASNAKTQLESWYNLNITGVNASKVANGKYCNDRNVQSESAWEIRPVNPFIYAALIRMSSNSPTLTCPSGDVYTLNVGLITADEAMYAGGRADNNTLYYLYDGQFYLTMSPYQWFGTLNEANVFSINVNGLLGSWKVSETSGGLRPVINLKADVTFSGGNGTIDNPYVVE